MSLKAPFATSFRISPVAIRRFLWIGLALFFIGLFLKVTLELREDANLDSFDRNVLVFVSQHRIDALNGPAVDLTALGSPTVLTLFSIIGVSVLWLTKDRRGALYLAVGSGGAGISTYVMKNLFTRPRPSVAARLVEVSGFSYPSGHSLASASFYLLIMFLTWRRTTSWSVRIAIAAIATILITGICFSRLYLGVHYPTDVLSGVLLGAAWACLLTAAFSRNSDYARS